MMMNVAKVSLVLATIAITTKGVGSIPKNTRVTIPRKYMPGNQFSNRGIVVGDDGKGNYRVKYLNNRPNTQYSTADYGPGKLFDLLMNDDTEVSYLKIPMEELHELQCSECAGAGKYVTGRKWRYLGLGGRRKVYATCESCRGTGTLKEQLKVAAEKKAAEEKRIKLDREKSQEMSRGCYFGKECLLDANGLQAKVTKPNYPGYEALKVGDKVTVVKTDRGFVTIKIQDGDKKEIIVKPEDWEEYFHPLHLSFNISSNQFLNVFQEVLTSGRNQGCTEKLEEGDGILTYYSKRITSKDGKFFFSKHYMDNNVSNGIIEEILENGKLLKVSMYSREDEKNITRTIPRNYVIKKVSARIKHIMSTSGKHHEGMEVLFSTTKRCTACKGTGVVNLKQHRKFGELQINPDDWNTECVRCRGTGHEKKYLSWKRGDFVTPKKKVTDEDTTDDEDDKKEETPTKPTFQVGARVHFNSSAKSKNRAFNTPEGILISKIDGDIATLEIGMMRRDRSDSDPGRRPKSSRSKPRRRARSSSAPGTMGCNRFPISQLKLLPSMVSPIDEADGFMSDAKLTWLNSWKMLGVLKSEMKFAQFGKDKNLTPFYFVRFYANPSFANSEKAGLKYLYTNAKREQDRAKIHRVRAEDLGFLGDLGENDEILKQELRDEIKKVEKQHPDKWRAIKTFKAAPKITAQTTQLSRGTPVTWHFGNAIHERRAAVVVSRVQNDLYRILLRYGTFKRRATYVVKREKLFARENVNAEKTRQLTKFVDDFLNKEEENKTRLTRFIPGAIVKLRGILKSEKRDQLKMIKTCGMTGKLLSSVNHFNAANGHPDLSKPYCEVQFYAPNQLTHRRNKDGLRLKNTHSRQALHNLLFRTVVNGKKKTFIPRTYRVLVEDLVYLPGPPRK